MSKILITGGLGFVGGRLSRRLSEEHEVYVSSRKRPGPEILQLYGNIKLVGHQALLSSSRFPASIDTVIHLAALNEWDSVKDPSEAIRVNVDETRIILENSIAAKVDRFIYFSTAHIYGAPLVGKITEDTLPVPIHPYAITHRAAEDFIIAATKQKRVRGIIFRLSNAFGAPVSSSVNRWTLLANDLSRQAVEKGKLSLLSNGCQYRDFLCLTDVEEIIASLAGKNMNHIIYNLGSGQSMQVIELARKISQLASGLFKKTIPIGLPENSSSSVEEELHYSIDRLLGEGFRILNPVDAELERLLKFCKSNFVSLD
jgi:UDP-glucose 4-epimerase